MKMLNNGLGADVFAISRTPIPSPQSTKMGEGDRRCAAHPPEPPAQVHPDHHVEDEAVAEHVDGVEHADGAYVREQKKDIKTASFLPSSQNVWPLSTRDGSETQTHQDSTSTTRQTITTPWSSGGCRGQPAYRDSQSWLWDHQSHRGSSNQARHRHW